MSQFLNEPLAKRYTVACVDPPMLRVESEVKAASA
jgi:hypothetical protein